MGEGLSWLGGPGHTHSACSENVNGRRVVA